MCKPVNLNLPADLPICYPTNQPVNLPTKAPTCLPDCDYLITCQPADLPTCLPAILPNCLLTYLSTSQPANLQIHLAAYLCTCQPAYPPNGPPANLLTCPLPTCLPAYFSSWFYPHTTCFDLFWYLSGVGGWVAGSIGNIATSAQLELELGLSLAKSNFSIVI